MRRRWLLLGIVWSACSSPDPAGTVGYVEGTTHQVRLLDVATGDTHIIDMGPSSTVSIAPDGQHVGYQGADTLMRIADRAPAITTLLPSGGCTTSGEWPSSTAFIYCLSTADAQGFMLVSPLGSPPRLIPNRPILSADGSQIVYARADGALVIESIDGATSRVLLPTPTEQLPTAFPIAFTPDQRAVLLYAYAGTPAGIRIVSIADGTTIDVADARFGTSFTASIFRGASMFSPDGSEVVARTATDLVAIDLATGATRSLAPLSPNVTSDDAAFLDDGRVLWVRVESFAGGEQTRREYSLHVAGTDDVTLASSVTSNTRFRSIAVAASVVAVPNANALLVATDGTVVVHADANYDDILGFTPEGSIVAKTTTGELRLVNADGTVRKLADASIDGDSASSPTAAYAPARP